MRRDLGAQVVEVDVAELVARDDDDLHAGEHRADAALVPCALDGMRQTMRSSSPRDAVVPADREQPGELALAAGVRLQRDRVVAGDLGEPALELLDHAEVALDVLARARTGGCSRTPAR